MRYQPANVTVDESQEKRLTRAIRNKTGVTLKINFEPSKPLLLTKQQIQKIDRAKLLGKNEIEIKMSAVQVKVNTEHEGGLIWSLAARIAPAILSGVVSALSSKATKKVIERKGHGLFLQKNGKCAKIDLVKGGGLYLSPHSKFRAGEGLFEAEGSEVSGAGLLLGDNSPFKNVPLLKSVS